MMWSVRESRTKRCPCYDWVSSEEGKMSETGRSTELAFVQRDWS